MPGHHHQVIKSNAGTEERGNTGKAEEGNRKHFQGIPIHIIDNALRALVGKGRVLDHFQPLPFHHVEIRREAKLEDDNLRRSSFYDYKLFVVCVFFRNPFTQRFNQMVVKPFTEPQMEGAISQ